MVVVLNEKKHAERMVEEGFLLNRKLSYELGMLYKFYSSYGLKDEEIEHKLHDFCKFWLRGEYNYVKFIKIIERVIKYNKGKGFKNEGLIYFSKKELETIKTIEDIRLQKVLFIMMFFAKIDGSGYCNIKETQVFKMAGVNIKPDKRMLMLRKLFVDGFIKPTMTGGDKILCLDTNEGQKKDGLIIDSAYNPIVHYLEYLGDKRIKACFQCGQNFIGTGNKSMYCSRCKEIIRLEQWRESKKRRVDGN